MTEITPEDNGVYSCKAKNLGGEVESTSNYILNIQGKLHFQFQTAEKPEFERHIFLVDTNLKLVLTKSMSEICYVHGLIGSKKSSSVSHVRKMISF